MRLETAPATGASFFGFGMKSDDLVGAQMMRWLRGTLLIALFLALTAYIADHPTDTPTLWLAHIGALGICGFLYWATGL